MILTPVNHNAATATWTMVVLTSGEDCEDYAVQARTSVALKISNVAAGTTYWTIKAGSTISLNEILGPGAGFFYVQSITSAAVVEVLPLRRHRGR